ncbi:CU044_5270 family protein [Streptomyces sp. NPDC050263]|uniref:CU044_5270 family protein n=1 Tax=Streptomyces sp. NPDC050263 TaxID=3155037 RepID=UPI003446620F
MARKRPDVMKMLAQARPAEFDPARLAGSERARDDLAAILASTQDEPETRRAVRPARPARPFSWGWALPAAATAVVAAVVVGTLADGGAGTGVDAGGYRASAGASTDGTGSGQTPANGRLALLNVAAQLDSTAQDGAYWQLTTRSASIGVIAEPVSGFSVLSTETQQWSYGVKSGTESLWVSGIDDSTQPRTARDRQRWQAAGSPQELTLAGGGISGGKLGLRIESASESQPTTTRINVGDEIAALGADNVTYADLQKLPGDSTKLKAYLAGLYKEDGDSEISDRTEWMWQQAAGLIGLPVTAEVRAAAYRVIADLPGIVSLGEVTDPLGRKGVGFALPASDTPDYGAVRSELIVDPNTGAMLSEQRTVTEPNAAAAAAGVTAGTLVNYTATEKAEWSDRPLEPRK